MDGAVRPGNERVADRPPIPKPSQRPTNRPARAAAPAPPRPGALKVGAAGRPGGSLPPIVEVKGGVVTGASKSAPAPSRAQLPTLAPPRRREERGEPARESTRAEADDIDIELEAYALDEDAGGESSPAAPAKPADGASLRPSVMNLPSICMYGRYEVLGRIAFGGMAEIFLGRESTSVGASRYLVIKRILPHVADDGQFVEMFLDEARLAIQLNHPNICHIYEFGELEDSYFITMEWVNGVPLGKLIRKSRLIGGVPAEIGVRIIAQISEALHYAHRARDALGRAMNIVHRDVSPHNIMVAYDGQVKLLDFGIAKATTHASKTEAGVVKGKFSYMAPEQCLGKEIDARADVFALGICLYEVLTGEALYHRDNEYETMRAVIHDPAPPITEKNAELPAALDAIVQKALAKEPDERYASAGELQQALERWLADARRVVNASKVAELMDELYEEQIQRGPLVDSTPFGQSFQRMKRPPGMSDPLGREASQPTASAAAAEAMPARRSPALLLGVAAVLLAAGLGGGYALSHTPTEEPAPTGTAPVQAAVVDPQDEPPDEPEPDVEEDLPAPVVEAPPAPTVGTLLVTSTPSGAFVRVDGERVEGTTPMTIPELPPGAHAIVVERAGYRDHEGDVQIVAGEQASVAATLPLLPREPAAPPGRLSINTRPWSKVYVGRQLLGTTPIAEAEVVSGNVRLRLVDRDGNTHTKSVQVGPGATERVFYDLAP